MQKIGLRILTFFFVSNFFLLTFSLPISAHTLKTDGSIGAVLHIDPNDEPIAKGESNIYFEIKDTQDKFRAADCNCKVSITENGNVLFDQAILGNSDPDLNSPTVTFTFPEKGVYKISLSGVPKTNNAFQSFDLAWNIRVEEGRERASLFSSYASFGAIGLLIIIVIIFAFTNFKKKGK